MYANFINMNISSNFDWEVYINRYSDLIIMGINTPSLAFEHWNRHGKYEGRIPSFNEFDWKYYVNRYDDLKHNINTRSMALRHWFTYGQYEGRLYNATMEANPPTIIKKKFNNILLIGDSHSNLITLKNNFKHLLCSAGSAKGLNNPNSRSGYNNLIINTVKSGNYDLLIFFFGGVDVDFSFIHKYLDNPTIDYRIFNQEVVDNYIEFINKNFVGIKSIVLSVGLPTLSDSFLKNGLLNADINRLEGKNASELESKLSNVTHLPNIETRTKITLDFNARLQTKIKQLNQLNNNNILFLDVTYFQYDDVHKRIKNDFFSRIDHHCYKRNITISNIINNFIDNLSC